MDGTGPEGIGGNAWYADLNGKENGWETGTWIDSCHELGEFMRTRRRGTWLKMQGE